MEILLENPAQPCEIIDTHAHYDDEKFDGARGEILSELPKLGVGAVINCAVDLYGSAEKCSELAAKYGFVYSALGIHPESVDLSDPFDGERLAALIKADKKCVAIGEIGLDYHWRNDNRAAQISCLENQLLFAKAADMPVILHSRDSTEDMLTLLQKHRPTGVLHCFSGSAETAREVCRLGLYIGIGGVITFKNSKKLKAAAAQIPLDKILLETDAPYMAPEPYRGQVNNSAYICRVAEKIAEIKGVTREEVFAANRENAARLFGIKPDV